MHGIPPYDPVRCSDCSRRVERRSREETRGGKWKLEQTPLRCLLRHVLSPSPPSSDFQILNFDIRKKKDQVAPIGVRGGGTKFDKMAPIQNVAPKTNKMAPKINKMAPIQNVAPKINKMATKINKIAPI